MRHIVDVESAPIPLALLPTFVAVARHQSFSAAGLELGLDRSRVSRLVAQLEAALGLVLFTRTTRLVRPTAEARALLDEIAPALGTLTRAIGNARALTDAPQGTVTLTSTPELARHLVAPLLPAFRQAHPQVDVELVTTDGLVDLADRGVDLALRLGRPGPASGVAKKVATLEVGFFAAPAYLERRGVPRAPSDLAVHERLWPRAPKDASAFGAGLKDRPRASITAEFDVLAAAARAGGGVALLPVFVARSDVAQGLLVPVLSDARLQETPLYLVTRPERPRPPRVEVLHRFLAAALPRRA